LDGRREFHGKQTGEYPAKRCTLFSRALPYGSSPTANGTGTYILCVVLDVLFPSVGMKVGWGALLPGFTRLAPTTFIPGLVETYLIGVLFVVTIAPIYNLYFLLKDRLEEIQALRYGDRLKYI
jgi:hypothetical protein